MLDKKQKRMLKLIVFLTILVNLSVVIPFNSFGLKNALTESLIKFIVAPIVLILLLIYPHVLKRQQLKNNEDASQIVAVVDYHPLLNYFVSVFLFGTFLVTRYDASKISALYTVGLILMVALAVAAYVYSLILPRLQIRYDIKKHRTLNTRIVIAMVVVGAVMIFWNNQFKSNYTHDTHSVIIFLVAFAIAFANGYYYNAVFQRDAIYRVLTITTAKALAAETAEREVAQAEATEVVAVDNESKKLTVSQKQLLLILFGVSLFLAFLFIFPFNILFGWYKFELIFKFFILPVLIIGALGYPIYLLYKQDQKDGVPQAIALSVYLPFFIGLMSVCTYAIYLLFEGGHANLGINVWGGLIAFNVIVLLIAIFLIFFFPRVQVAWKKKEHIIADITLLVIYLCIHTIMALLFTTYKNVDVKMDWAALFLFVFFGLYVALSVLNYLKVLKQENLLLEVPVSVRELIERERLEKIEKLREEQIERERRYKELPPKEVVVEKVVEVRRDLTEAELKEMYDTCYQKAYHDALEQLQGFTFKVEPQNVIVKEENEVEEEPEVVEVYEKPEVVEQVATEGEEVAEAEKEKRPIKIIQPSFIDVINYAGSIPGVTFSVNEKQTNYRFMHNKKLFLIAVNSRSGYNLHFLAEIEEIINMIIKYPDIFKAKTPKGENWFKLVNRGDFPEDVIYDIIEHSFEMLDVLERRKKEEKERIKQIKREARAAERAKLREAQKVQKAAEKTKK